MACYRRAHPQGRAGPDQVPQHRLRQVGALSQSELDTRIVVPSQLREQLPWQIRMGRSQAPDAHFRPLCHDFQRCGRQTRPGSQGLEKRPFTAARQLHSQRFWQIRRCNLLQQCLKTWTSFSLSHAS